VPVSPNKLDADGPFERHGANLRGAQGYPLSTDSDCGEEGDGWTVTNMFGPGWRQRVMQPA